MADGLSPLWIVCEVALERRVRFDRDLPGRIVTGAKQSFDGFKSRIDPQQPLVDLELVADSRAVFADPGPVDAVKSLRRIARTIEKVAATVIRVFDPPAAVDCNQACAVRQIDFPLRPE